MSPRKPSGNPPGRRPAPDQSAVRRNVRSARFTDDEAEVIDATPGGLRALVVERIATEEPTSEPNATT